MIYQYLIRSTFAFKKFAIKLFVFILHCQLYHFKKTLQCLYIIQTFQKPFSEKILFQAFIINAHLIIVSGYRGFGLGDKNIVFFD